MENPKWLDLARRFQAIAQNGLTYCKDGYDRQRYEELQGLAAEMMATAAGGIDRAALGAIFEKDTGYATPKIDIRTAVFREERVLLVKEREDGLWTLPGGWVDVGESPGAAAAREVKEESGYEVGIRKLAALYDRDKHGHPPMAYHVYKLFFIGELRGGKAQSSIETSEADFFPEDGLPPLSVGRVTAGQIRHMFGHWRNPAWATTFD